MKAKKILAALLCVLLLCPGCGSREKAEELAESAKTDTVTIIAPEDGPEAKTHTEDTEEHSENIEKPTESPKPTAADTKIPEEKDTEEPEETEAAEATRTPSVTDADPETVIASYLENMTLEEKVAQMFIVTPESVTDSSIVTLAGDQTKAAIENTPLGGFVYLAQNLQNPSQVSEMLANVQQFSMDRTGLPMFTCVDEEGGAVARLNQNPNFGLNYIGNMSDIGNSGNVEEAYNVGREIGGYLSELGFNVDFAPVADVLTNPDNEVVKYRSFGSDPEMVADMSSAVLQGLREKDVLGTFKHFPGHGATEEDSHTGNAFISKAWEELESSELIPFQRGIEEDVDFIMVGHISLPNVIGDDTPASLSYKMITEILRNEMGYQGLIITDALNMGAIDQLYSSGDAAVKTIHSGADIVLMPSDFQSSYQAVLNAVNNSTLSIKRIDDSVTRILRAKLRILETMQNKPAPLE